METDPFPAFWHATWSVWRSGGLASVGPSFKLQATCAFDAFLTDELPGGLYGIAARFFGDNPPEPGEILFLFWHASKQPLLVMTNLRLWLFDRSARTYSVVKVPEMRKFSSRSGWTSTKATIWFSDGSRRDYVNIAMTPNDHLVQNSIELCRRRKDWTVVDQILVSSGPQAAPEVEVSPRAAKSGGVLRALGPQGFIVLGIAVGSAAGVVAGGAELIGGLAILGGLGGAAAWLLASRLTQ